MKPPSILLLVNHSHFHSRDLFRLLKCPVAPSPHFNALYSLESLARKAKTLTLILYLSRSSDLTHPELAIIYGDQKAEPFLLTTPPLRFLTKLLPSTVCLADPTSFNEANSQTLAYFRILYDRHLLLSCPLAVLDSAEEELTFSFSPNPE